MIVEWWFQEVKDSLDKKAVVHLMTECFEHHGIDKKKLAEMKYLEEEGVPMQQKKSTVAVFKEKLLRSLGVNTCIYLTYH